MINRHESIGLARRYTPHGKPSAHVSALAGTRSIAGSLSANQSRLGVSGGTATSFSGVIVPPTKLGYTRIDVSRHVSASVDANFPIVMPREAPKGVTVLPSGIARNQGQNKPAFSVKTEADAEALNKLVTNLQAELDAIKETAKSEGTALALNPRVRQIRHELTRLGVSGKGKKAAKGKTPEQTISLQTERQAQRARAKALDVREGLNALESAILRSATDQRQADQKRNKETGEITPELSVYVDAILDRLHTPSIDSEGTRHEHSDCYLLDETKQLRLASAIIADACDGKPSISACLALRGRSSPMTRNSTRNVKHVSAYEALRSGNLRAATIDERTGQVTFNGEVMVASKGWVTGFNDGMDTGLISLPRRTEDPCTVEGMLPAITGGILARPNKYPMPRNRAKDHGPWVLPRIRNAGIVSSDAPRTYHPQGDVTLKVIGDEARATNAAMRAMRP